MPPILDLVDSALGELSQQPWGHDSYICDQMKTFEDGPGFLTMFLDCIHKWSDAEDLVPHLGSLATKIEASIQKIGDEFLEKIKRDKQASVFATLSFNLWGNLEKRASRWLDVFTNLSATIDLLKPQIAEARDILSTHSVQSHSPMRDFDGWKKFIKSTYLKLSDVADNFEACDRRKIRFVNKLSFFEVFLDSLAYGYLRNPKTEDFMIKVGSVTIHGALLSSHWWARKSDPYSTMDVPTTLSDLQQKISFTNPEFVDTIIRLLKASKDSSTTAKMYFVHLIPFTKGSVLFSAKSFLGSPNIYSLCDVLYSELISLVTSVLDVPEEDAEDLPVQICLSEIKQLLLQIASLRDSLYHLHDISAAGYLLAKIWLIKLEIFLRTQLIDDNILPVEKQIDDLNQMAKVIKKASEGSTKNVNQIWTLMEEVANEVASLLDA